MQEIDRCENQVFDLKQKIKHLDSKFENLNSKIENDLTPELKQTIEKIEDAH